MGLLIGQGQELEQRWQEQEALRQEPESLRKGIEEWASQRPAVPFRMEEEKRKKEKSQAGWPKGHRRY